MEPRIQYAQTKDWALDQAEGPFARRLVGGPNFSDEHLRPFR